MLARQRLGFCVIPRYVQLAEMLLAGETYATARPARRLRFNGKTPETRDENEDAVRIF
jgi:hypothetical protein